jgi:catechol 2,3-dioxygenase-like lactoylglutathione lyase family enzyme
MAALTGKTLTRTETGFRALNQALKERVERGHTAIASPRPCRANIPGMISSMIGRMHHVVLDCPDPAALAAFYSALLGLPVSYRDDDWVVIAASDTSSGLAFQRASDNQPPTWPDPAVPQQFHLDIMVEDVATAGPQVLALGAAKLDGKNVYADPAGHPFCLIRRPRWAPPIPDA